MESPPLAAGSGARGTETVLLAAPRTRRGTGRPRRGPYSRSWTVPGAAATTELPLHRPRRRPPPHSPAGSLARWAHPAGRCAVLGSWVAPETRPSLAPPATSWTTGIGTRRRRVASSPFGERPSTAQSSRCGRLRKWGRASPVSGIGPSAAGHRGDATGPASVPAPRDRLRVLVQTLEADGARRLLLQRLAGNSCARRAWGEGEVACHGVIRAGAPAEIVLGVSASSQGRW